MRLSAGYVKRTAAVLACIVVSIGGTVDHEHPKPKSRHTWQSCLR